MPTGPDTKGESENNEPHFQLVKRVMEWVGNMAVGRGRIVTRLTPQDPNNRIVTYSAEAPRNKNRKGLGENDEIPAESGGHRTIFGYFGLGGQDVQSDLAEEAARRQRRD